MKLSKLYTLVLMTWVLGVGLHSGFIEAKNQAPEPLSFSQPGEAGIFDPSVRKGIDEKSLWMSYSSGDSVTTTYGQDQAISTRIALSTNAGDSWKDQGVVVFPAYLTPLPAPANSGVWNYEVSNLVYDPDAPHPAQKWKIFVMRYLATQGIQHFEDSWIAMKTAPFLPNAWSKEIKLFTGASYSASDDAIIGPPEMPLNQIQDLSGNTPLSDCTAFTEPGAIAQGGSLYLALVCATASPTDDRIVLLKLSHPSETWSYVGVLLSNSTDTPPGFTGLSAPEFFRVNGVDYLLASPTLGDTYHGCIVYRVHSLTKGQLARKNGAPIVVATVPDIPGALSTGACAYDSRLKHGGILMNNRSVTNPPPVQIMQTFIK